MYRLVLIDHELVGLDHRVSFHDSTGHFTLRLNLSFQLFPLADAFVGGYCDRSAGEWLVGQVALCCCSCRCVP